MKITEILERENITLSFEVFPPKTEANYSSVENAALSVASLHPSYMSVTYGAGGNTRKNTLVLAQTIQKKTGVTAIAHLTCVGARRENIRAVLAELKEAGIENVLALRGDRPKDFAGEPFPEYRYASELAAEIRDFGGFCIGGACYPEGHVEAGNRREDVRNLKYKVEAGCEFLTTQMFFENAIFFRFLYQVREQGISVPVIPGIMPITRASQVEKAVKLSGTLIPDRFRNMVDRFGSSPLAMEQAGIAYATEQIIDLIANGINNIHVYSMNKPEVAAGIQRNLSAILSGM